MKHTSHTARSSLHAYLLLIFPADHKLFIILIIRNTTIVFLNLSNITTKDTNYQSLSFYYLVYSRQYKQSQPIFQTYLNAVNSSGLYKVTLECRYLFPLQLALPRPPPLTAISSSYAVHITGHVVGERA